VLRVDVAPEQAYGVRDDALVRVLPREAFQGVDEVEPGMQFRAEGAGGPVLLTVVDVGEAGVTVDGNHPLAGQTLHFDVEVADVREASEQEKQLGRAQPG
jgi:FKBP-type peptidyl-prolyl cis-trans isomerase SlyD